MFICDHDNPLRIEVPNLTGTPWTTEKEVYCHLLESGGTRACLWEKAESLNTRGFQVVYFDHDLFTVPFIILPGDNDQTFQTTLYLRLNAPQPWEPRAFSPNDSSPLPKYISIITPFNAKWNHESDVYQHLLNNYSARLNLLYRAEVIRTHHGELIKAEHHLLMFPLLLTHDMTDEQLVGTIMACIELHTKTL